MSKYLLMKNVHFLIVITYLSILSCSCSAKTRYVNDMEASEKSKMLIASYFDNWKNDGTSFFDILDENVTWTVAGRSPVSGIYQGKANFIENAVKPILKQLSTPLQPELISLTHDKEYVWLHFKAKATAINGSPYENTYLWKIIVKDNRIITVVAFLDTQELTELMKLNKNESAMNKTIEVTKEYIGMWVTKDRNVRHELLPNNRYDEARGNRKSAYQGQYTLSGNHIDYIDDTGFTADGYFKDGILYHGGMILYKEKK